MDDVPNVRACSRLLRLEFAVEGHLHTAGGLVEGRDGTEYAWDGERDRRRSRHFVLEVS